MPICQYCGQPFPSRITIDGKIHNLQRRKYCLECSPFNGHNSRCLERKGKKRVSNLDGGTFICEVCGKEYVYRRGHGDTTHKCNSCFSRIRRDKFKTEAIAYLGGKCSICGYNKCNEALEFHHIDPSAKSFTIASNMCLSWNQIQTELDKCVLLCANCHREVEHGLAKINDVT